MPHPLRHKSPIPYPIILTSHFICVQIFNMVNTDVPASVGAPPLDTQHPILMDNLQHGVVLEQNCTTTAAGWWEQLWLWHIPFGIAAFLHMFSSLHCYVYRYCSCSDTRTPRWITVSVGLWNQKW